MFNDLNPQSGRPTPTSYEAMCTAILGEHPIPKDLPEPIRGRLTTAVDFVALAYEQANRDRWQLFGPLTNSGVASALLALELALKHRLKSPPGNRLTLGPLIQQGKDAGVLTRSKEHDQLWDELHANRNQLVHGDPEAPLYGIMAARIVGIVIDTIADFDTT